MAEYIEREAEDYWCERCCNFDKENVGMDATAICKLTGCLTYCQEYGGNCKGFNVPAADVVEVVRCKDCAVPHNKWLGCPNLNGLIPPPDFYCAKGERKGEGE